MMAMRAVLAVLTLALLGGVAPATAEELTVSVAVSMKEAVDEIGRRFAQARPGFTLRYNLGASVELQKQIEAGAPVDVFVSASQRQMDELERRALILPATRRAFARNALVAIKPVDSRVDLARPADLLGPRVRRVVVGNPKTVPAGQYAAEALQALRLWQPLQPRLVLAENVRQALEYVARGEVDAGLVYATDAAVRATRVTVAFRFPDDTHQPIVYPAAVVATSRLPAVATAFVQALAGADARAVLTRLGFLPPPSGSR